MNCVDSVEDYLVSYCFAAAMSPLERELAGVLCAMGCGVFVTAETVIFERGRQRYFKEIEDFLAMKMSEEMQREALQLFREGKSAEEAFGQIRACFSRGSDLSCG